MNIAVKLYADVSDKPAGIPDGWPAETVNLGSSTTLPEGSGWILMTEQELAAQKATNQAAYDAWIAPEQAVQESLIESKHATQVVLNAIDFGQSLIVEFSTINSVSSLTSAEIIEVSQRLASMQLLLNTGALYTALDAIASIPTDALLPAELLEYFAQKIRNYLGI